jgi:ElaB/YqjD/DUF883 family membrane-anchored ribosome-binding protein
MNMANSNNGGWKFWFGLFTGIAAGLYLNSSHGKQVRNETEAKLNKLTGEISEKTKQEVENLSQKTTKALEKSKGQADKASKDLKKGIHKLAKAAEEAVDKTETSYEKAADWAADKISGAKTNKLSDQAEG